MQSNSWQLKLTNKSVYNFTMIELLHLEKNMTQCFNFVEEIHVSEYSDQFF